VLDAPGSTVFDKMRHFEAEADWFRRLMLKEPRGFPSACVNLCAQTKPHSSRGWNSLPGKA
jgi:proline racemase